MVIDTHVGRGAPSDAAVSYCLNRGAVLAAIFVWYHQIAVERLVVRGDDVRDQADMAAGGRALPL